MGEAKSTTRREQHIDRQIAGLPAEHVTKISDGEKSREGRGSTSEKSQQVASKKWEQAKKK